MDKPTFQYLMDFYQLKQIPIFYKNQYVGDVTRNLEYKQSNVCHLKDTRDAWLLAFEQVEGIIELIKQFDTTISVDVNEVCSRDVWEYADYEGGPVYHHVYSREKKTITIHKWSGSMDEVFERYNIANDRLRYCNGHHFEFCEKNMEMKYLRWLRIIPECRHFHMTYRTGLVD